MRKIASTKQLQAELTKLLAYSKTANPSRVLIANELVQLGVRVAGELPPEFLENIKEKKEEAKDKKDDDKEDKKDQD